MLTGEIKQIQASLTKHVPAESVGGLLGAIGLLHALSRVFGPIVFNGLYASTVKTFPQAFFVLLAGIFVAALVASFLVKPHCKFWFFFMCDDWDVSADDVVVYMEDDGAGAGEQEREPLVTGDALEDDELAPGLTP